jgi:hypothetical protein
MATSEAALALGVPDWIPVLRLDRGLCASPGPSSWALLVYCSEERYHVGTWMLARMHRVSRGLICAIHAWNQPLLAVRTSSSLSGLCQLLRIPLLPEEFAGEKSHALWLT